MLSGGIGTYEAIGYRHAAATAHPRATEAAIAALRRGGGAVDAAIAANAVLAVTQPDACGIGGDLFALVYVAAEDRVRAYAAAGPAGSGTDRAAWRRRHERIPPHSALAVTLPGAVRGWDLLHRRHGRLPWADLLRGAAEIAREGHPLTRKVAQSLTRAREYADAAFCETFLPGGKARSGSLLRNPDLARTLDAIAAQGAGWYYEGPFSEALEETLRAGGGGVTAKDMAAFSAEEVQPLQASFRGRTVFVPPPPSQGVALLLILRILGRLPAGASPEDPGWLHLSVEAKRRAYLLRDRLLADPSALPRDWQALLDGDWADEARWDIDPQRARLPSPSLVPGDTTFLCTADQDGNACAVIQSLYQGVGSGILVPGFGVHLQNRGSYFSLEEGHPNAIAPGKRTAHTLMAAMLTGPGGLEAVLGTMGGDGQPQTLLQILTRRLDHGQPLEEAVAAPRWLDGAAQDPALQLEAGLRHAAPALAARGHVVRVGEALQHAMGHAQAIERSAEGLWRATADPRGDGIGWAE